MDLTNARVAILATDGFEESELAQPADALRRAGATVHIIAPKDTTDAQIKSWDEDDWGKSYAIDKTLADTNSSDYHALVLPGGQINPDKLHINEQAVDLVKSFIADNKIVAAICHGPWLLAEADVLRGRKLTSFKSIKTDLRNAGADWQDSAVVVDEKLITSRDPDDLPGFIEAIRSQLRAAN